MSDPIVESKLADLLTKTLPPDEAAFVRGMYLPTWSAQQYVRLDAIWRKHHDNDPRPQRSVGGGRDVG